MAATVSEGSLWKFAQGRTQSCDLLDEKSRISCVLKEGVQIFRRNDEVGPKANCDANSYRTGVDMAPSRKTKLKPSNYSDIY